MNNRWFLSTRCFLLCFVLGMFATQAHWARGQAAPSITTQPQSTSSIVGSNVSFTVEASGQAPLVFQWFFNGVAITNSAHISGVASNTLVLNEVVTNDAGNYFVTVSNRHAVVTSSVAILTVLVPVGFTEQPTNRTVVVGTNTTFAVAGEGAGPLNYQWYFNEVALADGGRFSGSQTPSLTINGVITNDAGNYSAQITNAFSSAVSSNASLTVLVPVTLTEQPTNRTVVVGTNTTFTVAGEGTGPLNYQWYFNGVALADGGRFSGSKTPLLTINGVLTNDAGNYSAQITNAFSSAVSSSASLTVALPPPGVPFISGFSPLSGAVGAMVTISGGNFSANTSSNLVWFGAVTAPVIAASANQLTILVPTNASQSPISVLVNGYICVAASPFVVTYVGAGTFSASSFAAATNLPAGNTPIGVKIVDLDGDGKSDLVVANNTENTISVYRNIGTNGSLTLGSFAPRINFAVGASPRHVTIGDIDGDGKRDIVVANNGGSTVPFLETSVRPAFSR